MFNLATLKAKTTLRVLQIFIHNYDEVNYDFIDVKHLIVSWIVGRKHFNGKI